MIYERALAAFDETIADAKRIVEAADNGGTASRQIRPRI